MQTVLKLLMRDGASSVVFSARLSPEQYAELLARVERATTKDELRGEIQELSKRWGRPLEFDTELE
jgi:hypothetical protein